MKLTLNLVVKVIQQHSKKCKTQQQDKQYPYEAHWFFTGDVVYRDYRGARRKGGSTRWLTYHCNNMDCDGCCTVRSNEVEDAMTKSIETQIALREAN